MVLGQAILVTSTSSAAGGIGRTGLSVLCLPCHKGQTHTALRRQAKKKPWGIFLSICRSHGTNISAIQVYRFYELCQGFMDSPVSNQNINNFRNVFKKNVSQATDKCHHRRIFCDELAELHRCKLSVMI
jgi:hypothetical protein